MNKNNKLIVLSMILMLMIPASSAGPLEDFQAFGKQLDATVQNILSGQGISLSLIGTQTTRCDDGSTTCGATGEIFTISSNVMTGNRMLELVIPEGKKFTLSDQVITITAPLKLTLIPREPVLRIPLTTSTDYKYLKCGSPCIGFGDYTTILNTKIPYGDALITTNYGIQLQDKAGTSGVKEVSYNYMNPTQTNTVYITDGSGTATITAKHQNSGGIVPNTNLIIVPDINGNNGYSVFDRNTFTAKLAAQNQWESNNVYIWTGSQNWQTFLDRMKSLQGLQAAPLGNQNKYSVDGSYLNIFYTEDSIGTQVEARFPKTMVSSITELLSNGAPQILSAILSPSELTFGQGYGTLTVVVKNVGSADQISVYLNQATEFSATGGGVKTIAAGDSATYTFTVRPLSDKLSISNIRITATAAGSGKYDIRDVSLKINPSNPAATKFPLTITAYTPTKTIFSEAPIIVNTVNRGKGTVTVDVYDGQTYRIESADTNGFFAPSYVEVKVNGNAPPPVSIYFSATYVPPVQDYTWLFWLVIGIIIVLIAWYSGILQAVMANPALLVLIIVIVFMVWLMLQVLMVISGLADSMADTYDFVTSFGGLLK